MNKLLIWIIFPGLFLVAACDASSNKTDGVPTPPNIIFIMTDDQSSIVPVLEDAEFNFSDGNGRGTQSHPFGFNGDTSVYTPVIDQLAENGLVFSRAYVSSSVCSPSRYTTLTGRYAGRCTGNSFMQLHPQGTMTRVENNTELEMDRENLPRLLQQAGYRTGFVGKSHIIDHHLLRRNNWEEGGLHGYPKDADPNDPEVTARMKENHQFWTQRIEPYGFDYVNGVYAANLKELYNDSLNIHNLEWKNRAALEFIESSGDAPFFLYYSETVPHGPAPWIQKEGKYLHGLDGNLQFSGEGKTDYTYDRMPSRTAILEEVKERGIDPDQAWLTWFDHAVGAVVESLKKTGKLENTLIVITSDHGNYNYAKSTLYEGGVKVPLMMYWPSGIKGGTVYDELVQNIDYTPTFLNLAGIETDTLAELDGRSLTKVFRGNSDSIHDALFFEVGFVRGVMTKEWKYIALRYDQKAEKQIASNHLFTGWNNHTFKQPYYIRNSHLGYHAALLNPNYFQRDQLYDLINDPLEKNNLFETNPEQAAKMKALLRDYLKSFPDRPFGEFDDPQ